MFGRPVVALGVLLALSACESPARSSAAGDSGPSEIPAAILSQAEPIPRDEPLSASGNAASYVVFGETYHRLASAVNYKATGVASWYGRKFHGRATASGETYDMYSLTAAHRTLPLPTYVRVTNLDNQKSVVVRVNDRGPFVDDRLIDLSFGAAAKLDMVESGTARVSVVGLTGVPGEASASGHAVGPASGPASGSASGPICADTALQSPNADTHPIEPGISSGQWQLLASRCVYLNRRCAAVDRAVRGFDPRNARVYYPTVSG